MLDRVLAATVVAPASAAGLPIAPVVATAGSGADESGWGAAGGGTGAPWHASSSSRDDLVEDSSLDSPSSLSPTSWIGIPSDPPPRASRAFLCLLLLPMLLLLRRPSVSFSPPPPPPESSPGLKLAVSAASVFLGLAWYSNSNNTSLKKKRTDQNRPFRKLETCRNIGPR